MKGEITPLYKRFIKTVISHNRNTFLTREALEWLNQNKNNPTKQSWPQAVQTLIISPCLRHGLIVRTEKGFFHLTEKAFDIAHIEEVSPEDKEWEEYIQKKIKEAEMKGGEYK